MLGPLDIRLDIRIVKLDELIEHEEIDPYHLKELMAEILRDGYLRKSLAVDYKTMVILDGHHRYNILKRIGCRRVPVSIFDYDSDKIIVKPSERGIPVSKEIVRRAGLSGNKLPSKSSRHMVLTSNGLVHISELEIDVYASLDELR